MNPTPLLIVAVHLILLPLVFSYLKYVRIDEIFRPRTHPQIKIVIYILVSLAVTQLALQFFMTVFTQLSLVFTR